MFSLFSFKACKAYCHTCNAMLLDSTPEVRLHLVESARELVYTASTSRTWIYRWAATIQAQRVSSESKLAPNLLTIFPFSSPLSPPPLSYLMIDGNSKRESGVSYKQVGFYWVLICLPSLMAEACNRRANIVAIAVNSRRRW